MRFNLPLHPGDSSRDLLFPVQNPSVDDSSACSSPVLQAPTSHLAFLRSPVLTQSNTGFFMEVVLIAACEIWKMRNRKIFDNDRISLASWFVNFKAQCRLQSVRFKDDLRSSFCVWLDAFSLFCCFTLVVYSSNICKYAFPAFMKKENGSAVVNSPHIFLP